ncbi:MAG TPA: hypothetical protein VHO24_14455 [Opitutaceae bacterium]|nr:hypothetical protein [Opitutaceae bacterium]
MSLGLRLLFLVSTFGAAACAAAHALTFADIAFYPILLLVPLLFVVWPLVIWQYRRIPRKNLISEIFGSIPRWMKTASIALLFYAIANLFIASASLDGGEPARLADGRLVLKVKGENRRELTADEFRHAQALQVRMLTGHLLAFYAIAAFGLYACWLKSGPAMANAKIR